MRDIFTTVLCFCCIIIQTASLLAQSNCDNIGFESNNFSNWQAKVGDAGWNLSNSNPINNRHTIVSTQALDEYGNGQLFQIYPFGEGYSVRLGNDLSGGYAEGLERTVQVTAESHSFLIAYAVVFEDPGHAEYEQPKFSFGVYNQNNELIQGPCFGYSVAASADLPGFQHSLVNDTIIFRDWTTIAVDLFDYIGQTVRFSFRTDDCTLGGHFGYAYFDVKCGRMEIEAQNCSNGEVLLAVPSGFSAYQWSTGDTTRTISITDADSGQVFMVEASTEFGCNVILEFEYGSDPFTEPEVNLSSFLCDNQVSGVFTAPSGYNNYLWSNGETSATATYGGLNLVSEISVQLSEGPTCDTTIVIPIEPSTIVVEPSQTIPVTFCAESESIQLDAPSDFVGYQWPDFSSANQYALSNPTIGTTVQLWATPTTSVCPILIEYELTTSIPENPDAFVEVPICLLQDAINLSRPSSMNSGVWAFNNSSAASASYPNPVYGDTVFIHGADNSLYNCPVSTGFVFIKKTPSLPDSLSKTVFACIQKDTVVLVAEHPFDQYVWEPGGQADSSIQIINPAQGDIFALNAVGDDDCPYYRVFEIVGYPLPDSTVVMGPFCETTSRIMLVGPSNNFKYVWLNEGTLFSSGSSIAWLNDPQPEATITVEFTDTLGCRNTFEYTLSLNTQQTSIQLNHTEIPNVFSPAKADGFNDVFLFPFSNYDAFDLQVFNRWGQPVFNFSGTDELIQWDGKKEGQILPGGTYFYKLSLSACNSDEARNYEGTVLLMAD